MQQKYNISVGFLAARILFIRCCCTSLGKFELTHKLKPLHLRVGTGETGRNTKKMSADFILLVPDLVPDLILLHGELKTVQAPS